jgi:hypothetical protein
MKPTGRRYLLIIVFLLILSGAVLFQLNKKGPVPVSINLKSEVAVPKPIDTSTWTDYTNNQLGFSIKIPPQVPTLYRCPDKQIGNTPVKAYIDDQNGAVYISAEYYYDADWSQPEQKYIGACDKITYSLESLKKEESGKYASGRGSHPFLGWKIIINDPKDDNEVDSFVKQNFGSTCSIISKDLQSDGNYQIVIKGRDLIENGEGIMDENCYTNFVYKILYSQEKHKLMSVILGQECTFGTDPSEQDSYQCYDDSMIKSFKFR